MVGGGGVATHIIHDKSWNALQPSSMTFTEAYNSHSSSENPFKSRVDST